jgi:hypothetical protein
MSDASTGTLIIHFKDGTPKLTFKKMDTKNYLIWVEPSLSNAHTKNPKFTHDGKDITIPNARRRISHLEWISD